MLEKTDRFVKAAENINDGNSWAVNKNGEDMGHTTFTHSHPCSFNILCQNFADRKPVRDSCNSEII